MHMFRQRAFDMAKRVWPVASTQVIGEEELEHLVGKVTESLIDGNLAALQALFQRIDSPTPVIEWDPRPSSLEDHPRLDFLQRYWSERRHRPHLPPSSEIDAAMMKPALGYIMLLEPMHHGDDFLYRVYGTAIAAQAGMEMTGKRVRDVPIPLVAVFFLASYRAVLLMRRPLFARHQTHHDIQVAKWDRLILPFVDGAGRIDRLLVGNVPSLRR